MWRELFVVATGAGCLALVEVQIAESDSMDGSGLVRGRKDFRGNHLWVPHNRARASELDRPVGVLTGLLFPTKSRSHSRRLHVWSVRHYSTPQEGS